MLKIKSRIKNLGLIVALGLLSGTASATSVLSSPIYNTFGNSFDGGSALSPGDWGASRFTVGQVDCPNGCDVKEASLDLFDGSLFFGDTASLDGITLSVYSDGTDANGVKLGNKLFSFDNPAGIGAGLSTLSFSVTSGENSFVSNDTFYWLALENDNRSNGIEWGYSYAGSSSDYSMLGQGTFSGDFASSPFLFTLNGSPSVSAVPVPGAVWLMGSSLFGLLAVSRRKLNK